MVRTAPDDTRAGPQPGCVQACRGCAHRDASEPESLAAKADWVRSRLEPWADRLQPIVGPAAGERLAYRDRAILAARWAAGWRFGFARRDAFIPIPDCPVHTPGIREALNRLSIDLPPPDRGQLAYVILNGAQALLLYKQRRLPPDPPESCLSALRELGFEGIWLHANPSAGNNLYLKQPWRLAAGRRCSLDREGLRYGPTVFRQVQPPLYQAALAQTVRFLAPGPHRPLVDLYCGTGSSLAHWRHQGSPCLGVERDGAAVRCARLNHPGQPILQGRCGDRLPQVRDWLTESNAPAAVFANPPRTGLEPAVGAWLRQESRCHRLAYLSCSPGTLGRDLQGLTQAGWTVETIHPYDFFPQTHHVETLALATRTDSI